MESDWSLVERDLEVSSVSAALKRVEQHDGSLIVFAGPAGIGKSRLLADVKDEARSMGLRIMAARCSELERDIPFGMVRQLFEPLLIGADPASRASMMAGAAAQAANFFDLPGSGTEALGDFAVLHGLFWLTSNASRIRPLVLLIDDIQWCDTPSLRYLAYLLPRLEGLDLLIAAGLRSSEARTAEPLLAQITLDAASSILRPSALSPAGTNRLLSEAFGEEVSTGFSSTCHFATGGNPLLLRELARAIKADGLSPSEENASRVVNLGPIAVTHLVSLRMNSLDPGSVALANALAILGDRQELGVLAKLAEQSIDTAMVAAENLQRVEILQIEQTEAKASLSFVHPVVRSAVYEAIGVTERGIAHARAARLLIESGSGPDPVAAHLLHTPPVGEPGAVDVLRAAAKAAVLRGSPDTAVSFLRRCVLEPISDGARLEILEELGLAESAGDKEAAVKALETALAGSNDKAQRIRIAVALGGAYMLLLRVNDAAAAWNLALSEIPDEDEDTRRHIEARLINLAVIEPHRRDMFARLGQLRHLPFHDSVGGRALESMIGASDSFNADPRSLDHARRALSGGLLVKHHPDESPLVVAWLTLIFGDDLGVMESIEQALTQAHRRGALADRTAGLTLRSLARLRRGDLLGAGDDALEAVKGAEATGVAIARPFIGPFRADILLEQGRLSEAVDAMAWTGVPDPTPPGGPLYYYLDTRSRLLRAQGRIQQALDCALAAGERFAAHGGDNPAWIPWRSEAALCLHALSKSSAAQDFAAQEVQLARQFGAPRALGHALRVAGLVGEGPNTLDLLGEAVSVLESSPAKLEHAKALADLGAVLRRHGHKTQAREPLRRSLEFASICGATPLAELARAELLAAGARPRRDTLSGPRSLTPSERRVATMAAQRATNREIAQALFVTPKTVEVHLSSVYRKLSITTRTSLAKVLAEGSAEIEI